MRALLLLAIAGCGVNVGAPGEWVPVDQVEAPLAVEASATAPPSTFRSLHPVATDVIRVVTYNVDEENDIVPSALVSAIENDPDLASASVFLLQEVEAYPGEAASRIQPLAQALGLGYIYVPARIKDDPSHTHGLAILSAFPIENVEKKELPMSGTSMRIAVAADLVVGDRVLHIVDLHLGFDSDAATRIAQLRPGVIDAPDATLVAGDFNMSWVQWTPVGVPILSGTSATDQAAAVTSYMRALHFDAPTVDSGPTATAFGIEARVDAIFTRGLDATFGKVERVGPSDHWPVWADVRLR